MRVKKAIEVGRQLYQSINSVGDIFAGIAEPQNMYMDIPSFLQGLTRVEHALQQGKWARLKLNPKNYLTAIAAKYLFPRRGILVKARTLLGIPMQMQLPAHPDIYIYGCKAIPSDIFLSRYLVSRLAEVHVFIDIGANMGYYAVLCAALKNGTGEIHALEPSQSAFELLKTNSRTFGNIQIHNVAAGAKNDSITLFEYPILYAEYNTTQPDDFLKNQAWFNKYKSSAREIPMVQMDTFFTDNRIIPDIVKMDVENSDFDVILGMLQTIKTIGPELILRFWYKNRDNSQQIKAIKEVQKSGYQIFAFSERGVLQPLQLDNLSENQFEYIILKK